MRLLLLPLIIPFHVGCSNDAPQPADNAATTNTATSTGPTPVNQRDSWQKPEVVIGMMGGDLSNMTIADLFADDGYFTFKMIDAGANVIAVVNDAAKAEAITAKQKERGLGADRLQVRTVAVGDPGITNAEVDMALIAHSFVKIRDKKGYFERMRQGMKPPRFLVMVEWRNGQTPTGPPANERMSEEEVMDFIGTTGYSDVGAHSAQIPDQVIYLINDYMDVPEEGQPTE